MENESIEFLSISGGKEPSEKKEYTQMVRQLFRVPAPDKEFIQVIIRKKKYSVSDISERGIGIRIDSHLGFEYGEILTHCDLQMVNRTSLHNLTGKIIHCSSTEPGNLQYGIQWLDLGSREKKILNEIISQMKSEALKNNDRNITKV